MIQVLDVVVSPDVVQVVTMSDKGHQTTDYPYGGVLTLEALRDVLNNTEIAVGGKESV
jgi:RNA-splicing ligase RtcB